MTLTPGVVGMVVSVAGVQRNGRFPGKPGGWTTQNCSSGQGEDCGRSLAGVICWSPEALSSRQMFPEQQDSAVCLHPQHARSGMELGEDTSGV